VAVFASCVVMAPALVPGQTVPSGYQATTIVGQTYNATTTMAFLGPGDAFFLQQIGNVRRLQFGGGGATPTITTPLLLPANNQANESGLLGIALPPDFAVSHDVFLYYSIGSPMRNQIDRFLWNGGSLVYVATIATFPGSPGLHNGGIILFGPD